MSGFATLGIALLCGLLGLVCGALVMSACAVWYRISSFEGQSGYAVVAAAILSGMAASVLGWITAHLVHNGFLAALGTANGAIAAIALVALALCRLFADLAPTLGGRDLELDIEVRCPKGFAIPPPDIYGATAGVYLPGGRRQPTAKLRVDAAQRVDDHLVVAATVPLDTSSARKFLDVRFSREHDLLFHMALRAHPRESDLEWSRWIESGWETGKPEPPKDAKFHARYRIRLVEPPPPEPDPEDVRAQEFAALADDAPLEEFLPFLSDEVDERKGVVAQHVVARQRELAMLICSSDETIREHALQAVAWLSEPAPEVLEAVLGEGREIAAGVRHANTLPPEDMAYIDLLIELRSRFNYWKQAWWTLSHRLGLDGRPPVREIHELAKQRAPGTAMDEIEVNARVILEALDTAAAGNGQ